MVTRREFFRLGGLAVASGVVLPRVARPGDPIPSSPASLGCLVDVTLCTGCRKCEQACNQANGLPVPPPGRSFDDMAVLKTPRRPSDQAFTVVNAYELDSEKGPVYVKTQCMHCIDPACVSACIVGALRKEPSGPVTYDAGKCLGCRYCMVACPFQIPAYEYSEAWAPRVRKCTFCFDKLALGEAPACARSCPKEALLFGNRADLLSLANDRMATPGEGPRRHANYLPRIFGQNEVGGTTWMYLSAVPFEKLGFPNLPQESPARLTESIQHGIFKHFVPPLLLLGFLGLVQRMMRPEAEKIAGDGSQEPV